LRLATYDKLSRTTLLGARRGDLLMRVTADVESIMDVIVRVALPFCSAGVVLLGTSAILSFFSPAAAVWLLICSIVAGMILPWLTQRMSQRTDALAAPVQGQLADQVQQIADAGVDLVAYGAQDEALAEFSRLDGVLRDSERRAAWTRGLATGGQHVAMGLAVAAALILGARAVVRGDMMGRDLAVLCLTPLALHESFGDLTKAAQTLTHARTGLARVVELLTSRPVGTGDRRVADTPAGADTTGFCADDYFDFLRFLMFA
jgi:ABC-type transport system involved in cytochrome bd biosynthesis fused ATPase/permease subunit